MKNPNLRGRITVTEYFERPELAKEAIASLEEAETEFKAPTPELKPKRKR